MLGHQDQIISTFHVFIINFPFVCLLCSLCSQFTQSPFILLVLLLLYVTSHQSLYGALQSPHLGESHKRFVYRGGGRQFKLFLFYYYYFYMKKYITKNDDPSVARPSLYPLSAFNTIWKNIAVKNDGMDDGEIIRIKE